MQYPLSDSIKKYPDMTNVCFSRVEDLALCLQPSTKMFHITAELVWSDLRLVRKETRWFQE